MNVKTALLYVGLLISLLGVSYLVFRILNVLTTSYEFTDRSLRIMRRSRVVYEIFKQDICRVFVGCSRDYQDDFGVGRLLIIRDCSNSPLRAFSKILIIETKSPHVLYYLTPQSAESFAHELRK